MVPFKVSLSKQVRLIQDLFAVNVVVWRRATQLWPWLFTYIYTFFSESLYDR